MSASNVIQEGEPYHSSVVIDDQGLLSPIQENAVYSKYADNNETYHPPIIIKAGITNLCNCVMYLWDKYHDPRIRGFGLAKNIAVWSIVPYSTGYVITYESSAGHIALYRVNEQGQIEVIDEANYINCQYSSGRIIDPNIIKGYLP